MSSTPPKETQPASSRIVRFVLELPDPPEALHFSPFKPYSPITEIAHARIHTALTINGIDPHALELRLKSSLRTPLTMTDQHQDQNQNRNENDSQILPLLIAMRMLDILHGRAPPPAEPTLHDIAGTHYVIERAAEDHDYDYGHEQDQDHAHQLESAIENEYHARIAQVCREGRRDGVEYDLLCIMLARFLRERAGRERRRGGEEGEGSG